MHFRKKATPASAGDSARIAPSERPTDATPHPGGQALHPARVGAYVLIATAAALLPLFVWAARPWLLSGSYEPWRRPFEVLGLTGTLAVALVAFLALRARDPCDRDASVRVGVAALVTLFFLGWNAEYAEPSWDYHSYTAAAQALLDGANPYALPVPDGPYGPYLYPPLPAQAIAAVHRVASLGLGLDDFVYRSEPGWDRVVFYLYQCAQLALVVLAYFLLAALARRLGIPPLLAVGVAALLLMASNPVLRTLRHCQVNLWLLDLVLVAILLIGGMARSSADRAAPVSLWADALAGAAIALATHIKLYPVILLAPLVVMRRARAVAACLVFLFLVAFLQADFGRDWTIWRQYAASLADFPVAGSYRASSVPNMVAQSVAAVTGHGVVPGPDGAPPPAIVSWLQSGLVGLLVVWFALRMARRERLWRRGAGPRAPGDDETPRVLAHAADMLALALLASPLTWEHHFVLALPLALWAIAARGAERPVAVATALFVLLAVPTFDLYPLSYHRSAALLALLVLTAPGRTCGPLGPASTA